MNWNNFALGLIIQKSKPTKSQKILFIKNMVESAMKTSHNQDNTYISEDAIKKWLSKEEKMESIKPQIRQYFPNLKIETLGSEELLKYFHSQISNPFYKCQNKFRSIQNDVENGIFTNENYIVIDNNANFCIDCDTADEGQFLISLINQFATLMGLPNITDKKYLLSSVDFLSLDATNGTQKSHDNQVTPTASISDLEFCHSTDIVEPDKSDHSVVESETHFLSELTIPQECNICRFCEYWQAKFDEGRKMGSPINGECIEYNIMSSATTAKCESFAPHYGKINRYLFEKSFPNIQKIFKI